MPRRSRRIILLPRTPRIRRIVKSCDVVDRFLRKPFWFFQSIFSILGSMPLRIVYLGRHGCKGYTLVVLGYSEVTLLREREDASLYPSVNCLLVIYGVTVSAQYVVEFPCHLCFWGYFIKPCCFPNFNFSYY